jgi:Peptidase family S41
MKNLILKIVSILLFVSQSYSQQIIWKSKLIMAEFGELNTHFFMEKNIEILYGTTAPDAQNRIVGGLKGVFAKSMLERNGSLIALDSLTIKNDFVTGFMRLSKKKYIVKGTILDGKINLEITGKKGLIYGTIAIETVASVVNVNNYVTVWKEIEAMTNQKIFKKQILETNEWKDFVKQMNEFSKEAKDDAEFVYGFYYKASKLPFSHFSLIGSKENSRNFSIAGLNNKELEGKPTLQFNDDVAVLDIPKFNFTSKFADSLMLKVIDSNSKTLVIDLRKNAGGDMEGALRVCQYLTNKIIFGGVLLSQAYWNKNQNAPDTSTYSNFKLINNANYDWFTKQTIGVEGLCFKAEPLLKTYKGKIVILTSKNTASTCEPFVYALKYEKIATVVGENTAGAMLSMEEFAVSNFTLSIPMLDFYTVDGKRLDKVGVSPDIKADSNLDIQSLLKLTLK